MTYRAYLKQSAKAQKRILELVSEGVKQIEIARRFGISRQRVNQIVHPERNKARGRITARVISGTIPKARKLKCVDCGNPAKEYDHPNYEKSYLVEPVCHKCHAKRTPHWHSGKEKRLSLIMGLLDNGKSRADIARRLGISRQRVSQIVLRRR